MFEIKQLVVLFAVLVLCYYLVNRTKEQFTATPMPESAAEACKKIASKAEEIEAHYKGTADIVAAAQGPFNPRNYKSGDNTSDDMMRNIVNTNLSSEDIVKIQNDCKNISATMQINEIDMTQCPYCQQNGCSVTNVTQENIAKSSQVCVLQAATDSLRKKTNSIDAQALAQTLQKAQDLMSGNNKSTKQNCNYVNTDMSSKSYLEQISSCSSENNVNQENRIKGCGPVLNVIQRNANDNFQQCLSSGTITMKDETTNDQSFISSFKVDQLTTGLNLTAAAGSILSCCICSSVVAGVGYYMYTEQM